MNQIPGATQVSTTERSIAGMALLQDPMTNKGTAFSEAERDALGLRGLLPPRIFTQDEQVARVLENFRSKTTDLEKYINLAALHGKARSPP